MPEGLAVIGGGGGLNRLEKWADGNILKLNHGNCKVLHLGKNKPRHPYMQEVGATI